MNITSILIKQLATAKTTILKEANSVSQSITIKEITIRNFKSLFDVSFETGNVNVFIGANGSGKTFITVQELKASMMFQL